MNLHIEEGDPSKNITLYEWLGVPKDRANKLGELIKAAWEKYISTKQRYSFPQLLHDATEAVHTPEELFLVANMIGQWMGRSCKDCKARYLLEGILSGRLDVHMVALAHDDPNISIEDLLKERLKKDVN